MSYNKSWYDKNKVKWDNYMKNYNKKYEVEVSIIYGVYRKNDPDKKIVYVGESLWCLNNRKNRHKYDAKKDGRSTGSFHKAIREEGFESFEFFIITDEYCEHMTESFFIKLLEPDLNSNYGSKTRKHRFYNNEQAKLFNNTA